MARQRRRDPPAPGAVRAIGQLLVVVAGGVGIGGLLVLLAFPDALPVGSAVVLGVAGALAVGTGWLARQLGRVEKTGARKKPAKKPAKKPRARKATPSKKKATAKKKGATKRGATRKGATKRKTTAKKRATATRGSSKAAGQGRGRR